METPTSDFQNLFKLPWTTFDNPNGWIEPTTYCQLSCPGCYRGLASPNPLRIHQPLHKIKREIINLIKIRNIKILAIAGGEPLLYPDLDNLVTYANKQGLQVRLLTNGVALTKDRLTKLKKLGVTEVVIHISEYQKRPISQKIKKINIEREKYCQMFRETGGVVLNFIMTVSKTNFVQVPTIIKFYKKNSDIISRVIFTLYRDVLFSKDQEENIKNYISLSSLVNLIKKSYAVEPCAYLGQTLIKQNPSWLFFAPILLGTKTIGYADNKTIEKLHLKSQSNSWDSFPAGKNGQNLIKSISLLSLPTAQNIFKGYLGNILKNPKSLLTNPNCQTIIIINTPTLTNRGWNLCDGCPDAILYKNKLVPSCLLERIKHRENISLN
ncbi:hypothetical protein A3A49_01480 [Candidatus Curtissbacteria bacterium RIFCSPLOWO2_01_FULL_38_11b]|uniref:Radical SAM core domain-containing protein n=1 Tax=Candidatus Curtissbacteria bacterium RIFCSPLOWO2_01_FULL_38_11b TaxID=1797725 RepID=A0A1F5H3B8_9BACT|nr:MAG: hypothetical protein A3A49_01480 [Candidatus Curtissbacteria bacterium RIFCSPLOWO2_01_FULL_38_11b]